MFGHRVTLFKLFGFEVRVDLSWTILAALITFQWAAVLGEAHPGASTGMHWGLALVGTIGLFVSIVFHEMSHSLVARRFGMSIKGITLFLFGGVAEMEDEPPSARAEFWMAIVGPFSSVVLAVILGALAFLGRSAAWPAPVVTLTGELAGLNVMLAVFNTIPAFPLDGGRVLRSILWWKRKDLRWATKISSFIGSGFGLLLMLSAPLWLISGSFVNAMWFFLIGMFLRAAARMPYQQLVARGALEGQAVRRFMVADPVTVPRFVPVRELVEDYFYRHHFKSYPVMDGERIVGCVSLDAVKAVPREEWGSRSVGEIAVPCDPGNTIGPDEPATRALAKMSRGATRLLVVEGDRLVGVLSVKDLLSFIGAKLELEGR